MSILINGMEMPTCCFSCPMCDVENAEVNCAISHGSYIEYRDVDPQIAMQARPDWCPIVKIPPHGRLGDLDKLEQMFVDIDNAPYSGFDGEEPFYSAEDAAQIIRLTPTVIPADDIDD